MTSAKAAAAQKRKRHDETVSQATKSYKTVQMSASKLVEGASFNTFIRRIDSAEKNALAMLMAGRENRGQSTTAEECREGIVVPCTYCYKNFATAGPCACCNMVFCTVCATIEYVSFFRSFEVFLEFDPDDSYEAQFQRVICLNCNNNFKNL